MVRAGAGCLELRGNLLVCSGDDNSAREACISTSSSSDTQQLGDFYLRKLYSEANLEEPESCEYPAVGGSAVGSVSVGFWE